MNADEKRIARDLEAIPGMPRVKVRLLSKPGHREGVRRHQRYGQQALDLGRTLDPKYRLQ